ncbi:MAG: hypothetical protein WBC08_09655, partial [Rhodoferax sp.]
MKFKVLVRAWVLAMGLTLVGTASLTAPALAQTAAPAAEAAPAAPAAEVKMDVPAAAPAAAKAAVESTDNPYGIG